MMAPTSLISQSPPRSRFFESTAQVCMSRKDNLVEEAEAYYKMSLRAKREIPEPHFNLGLIYMSPSFDK